MQTEYKKQIYFPANFREDFKDKVKSWFQNRGILNKLELYLKNQMIVEFQRSCGQPFHSQDTTLLPQTQAVKVLVGDFLLQKDLLFSLSVYCTEVPFLLNLKQYSQYVLRLADSNKASADIGKSPLKPKFNKDELLQVLRALNLNLKADEFDVFYNFYKSEKMDSLLTSLLGTIPKLIRKHRTFECLLKKARKKEKVFQKSLKIEKSKLKNMYAVVRKAYDVVEKHKFDMKELLRNQNEIEMKFSEQTKKENELTTWQKMLELKEQGLEKSYRNKLREIEDRAKTQQKRELELQSKYQMLRQEKNELKIEYERIRHAELQLKRGHVGEVDKQQEFEQNFWSLQAEVREMLEMYNKGRRKGDFSGEKPTDPESSHEQHAEKEIFIDMEKYVNLVEKENTLLKFSSIEQRNHISRLMSEVMFLKSRLDYLEKKIEVRKRIEEEIRHKKISHTIFLSGERHHLKDENEDKVNRDSTVSCPASRRKLFHQNETTRLSEFSSSGTSKESNLTDDIVADANDKVKILENESEALDRNYRNLQKILTRNITLSDSKILGSRSVGRSSPRFSILSGSCSDPDCANKSGDAHKYALSSSCEDTANWCTNREFETTACTLSTHQRSNSFREFMKRKKGRIRSRSTTPARPQSECSSISSSPREKINGDAAVRLEQVPDEQSGNKLNDVVCDEPVEIRDRD